MLLPLWRDWQMMNRLHCTYTQLGEEPALEMAVFHAFSEGEASVERAARRDNQNQERVNIVG